MPVSYIQVLSPLRRRSAVAITRGLATLLLAAVPGALLICILHCAAPVSPGHGATSPFLCNHTLDNQAEAPPILSLAVVVSLIQGVRPDVPAALVPGLLALLLPAALVALGRLADAPLAPPPRPHAPAP